MPNYALASESGHGGRSAMQLMDDINETPRGGRRKWIIIGTVLLLLVAIGLGLGLGLHYGLPADDDDTGASTSITEPTTSAPPVTPVTPWDPNRLRCDPGADGEPGVDEETCSLWGCHYSPSDAHCYLPTHNVYSAKLAAEPSPTPAAHATYTLEKTYNLSVLDQELMPRVRLDIYEYEDDTLRFKFSDADDPDRWEVPADTLFHMKYEYQGAEPEHRRYQVDVDMETFNLVITRRSSCVTLWDMSMGGLVMSDQYLQLSTKLASENIYGFGENRHLHYRHDLNYKTWPMFTRDQAPTHGGNHPLYGVHPVYMCVEGDGNAHGVFLLNSNAMEYELQPTPALTLRTIGGVLDLYMMLGPSPENVVQQYTALVGRPVMPPYWSLGFQLSRWGYDDFHTMEDAVESTIGAGIPLDVQYADIDHMAVRKDFTYDMIRFRKLPNYIRDLQSRGMHVIIIVDPAIVAYDSSYEAYVRGEFDGTDDHAYIEWAPESNRSGILHGKVWPDGLVAFPDFMKEKTGAWWEEVLVDWHETLNYDGLWIDMNEPANFDTNEPTKDESATENLQCPHNKYEDPPYKTRAATVYGQDVRLSAKTLCMSAKQGSTLHYNAHSLYGMSEMPATLNASRRATGKRSLVISRSTYPGAGQYGYHWLGDNWSNWEDLHHSIVGMMEFNLFGMPYTGADICGFIGDADEQMCHRWMQLGAFYPYARNHNIRRSIAQHPSVWSEELIESSKEALSIRYRLLPYLYTLFYHAHTRGTTVVRPLLHEYPTDTIARSIDEQFLWGKCLLISPVLHANTSTVDAYFPEDVWYDYYTGAKLTATGNVQLDAPLSTIPIHVRGGFILPMQEPAMNTVESRQNEMGLLVAIGDEGEAWGDLFWDDGDSIDTIEAGNYVYSTFHYRMRELTMRIDNNGMTDDSVNALRINTLRILGIVPEDSGDAEFYFKLEDRDVSGVTYVWNSTTLVLEVTGLSLELVKPFTLHWSHQPFPSVELMQRIDCHPDSGADQSRCELRGCEWEVVNALNVPHCYYPSDYGYRLEGEPTLNTDNAMLEATLSAVTPQDAQQAFGDDFHTLKLSILSLANDVLRIKLVPEGEDRYEVPVPLTDADTNQNLGDATKLYDVHVENVNNRVSISVRRKSAGGRVLFDTAAGPIRFSDKFLELTTSLAPEGHMFGLGENNHWQYRHPDTAAYTWPAFARDQPPPFAQFANLYGVHPFYLYVEQNGTSHGVLFFNSNGQEYKVQPTPAFTFRSIGGIFDIFLFLGPTPEDVVSQFTRLIGRPYLPPYYSLGFQLCRYGYFSLERLQLAVNRTRSAGIPLDIQYADIDHMENQKDFTYDVESFGGLPNYIRQLQSEGLHFIIILDPAIQREDTYKEYTDGVDADAFIKWPNDTIMFGYVWPIEPVAFPDYLKQSARTWWIDAIVEWHKTIPFDALWIDMNEPANFGTNTDRPWNWPDDKPDVYSLKCPDDSEGDRLDDPPYVPPSFLKSDDSDRISDKTICMSGEQHVEWDGRSFITTHYNVHNLYGWSETEPTLEAAQRATGKRSLVVTRSTFPGSGKYSGHWLGDNAATWRSMKESVIGCLEFNIFGIPYTGADICGFFGNTTQELCQRWQQLGAFYTYSRNHNTRSGAGTEFGDDVIIDQDPGVFGAEVADSSRRALLVRYTLLPYLYTTFYLAHTDGHTVMRPLGHEWPEDDHAQRVDEQFLWGSGVLITPVLRRNADTVYGYFPGGREERWFSYHTGEELSPSGRGHIIDAPRDFIPVHIRGRHVIITQEPDVTTTASRRNPFGVIIAPGQNGDAIGALYWDDGDSINTEGAHYLARFTSVATPGRGESRGLVVDVEVAGYDEEPMLLGDVRVFGVETPPASGEDISITGENTGEVGVEMYTWNMRSKQMHIRFNNLSMKTSFTISW